MKKVQRGFTLIELLIVIAILGILAAIIVPNFARYIQTSRLSAANTEVAGLKTAIQAYSADNNGVFPTSIAQLAAYTTGTLTGSYNIDGNGNIVGVNGSWGAAFTFNTTSSQWQR